MTYTILATIETAVSSIAHPALKNVQENELEQAKLDIRRSAPTGSTVDIKVRAEK